MKVNALMQKRKESPTDEQREAFSQQHQARMERSKQHFEQSEELKTSEDQPMFFVKKNTFQEDTKEDIQEKHQMPENDMNLMLESISSEEEDVPKPKPIIQLNKQERMILVPVQHAKTEDEDIVKMRNK